MDVYRRDSEGAWRKEGEEPGISYFGPVEYRWNPVVMDGGLWYTSRRGDPADWSYGPVWDWGWRQVCVFWRRRRLRIALKKIKKT